MNFPRFYYQEEWCGCSAVALCLTNCEGYYLVAPDVSPVSFLSMRACSLIDLRLDNLQFIGLFSGEYAIAG